MKKEEDLIWSYLDDECSAEERSLVEKRVADNDSFRELFMQSQALHQNLRKMEVEMPSMRFTQNVMEALPQVRNLATSPLVSKKWLRVFSFSSLGMVLFFWLSGLAVEPGSARQEQPFDQILQPFLSLFDHLPSNTLVMGGIIFLSLLSLAVLDRWLQARLLKNE